MGIFGRKKKQDRAAARYVLVNQEPMGEEMHNGRATILFEDVDVDADIGPGWREVATSVAVKGVSRHAHARVVAASSRPGVVLIPDPANQFDPNAIRVVGYDGEQCVGDIGFLPAEIASALAASDYTYVLALFDRIYPVSGDRDGCGFRLNVYIQ